jgi:hypothetical protein
MSQHSSHSIHVGWDLGGVRDWMGVGIVPCLDPSESISASKAAGICAESDDSTLSTIVGFEVGESFVHERAVGTATVFIRQSARDEIQLVGSRRQDKRNAPTPSSRLSGAIHRIFAVLRIDWRTSGPEDDEGEKEERNEWRCPTITVFVSSPCLRNDHGLLAEGGHPFREDTHKAGALKDI